MEGLGSDKVGSDSSYMFLNLNLNAAIFLYLLSREGTKRNSRALVIAASVMLSGCTVNGQYVGCIHDTKYVYLFPVEGKEML
jgi:hypothetical protein